MKNLLLFCFLLFTGSTFAQVRTANVPDHLHLKEPAVAQKKAFKGDEPLMGPVAMSPHTEMYLNSAQTHAVGTESWIGTTYYDLQSNSSHATRIYANPDCDIKVSWTGHPNTSDQGFPNRGTFLSESEDCNTFSTPVARVEQGYRTGWGNILTVADGSNVIVAHTTDDESSRVIISREQTDGSYIESELPTEVPLGVLWPHAASAGDNIHIVAVNDPDTSYMGVSLALIYWRSTDGGATWDIQDHIIPGLTAAEFEGSNADAYSIDADENGNVAILSCNRTQDVKLLKSTSNGDIGSWEHTIVYDFPIDSLDFDGEDYTLDDIGGLNERGPVFYFANPDIDDSLAIAAPEGSGSVTLAADGTAHVVYTEYFVSAHTGLANGAIYFPGIGNLIYWNENMGENNINWVTSQRDGVDFNQNDTLDYQQGGADGYGRFGGDVLIGEPSIAEINGKIVIAYRQAMENFYKETSEQHYSHVLMTGTEDFGGCWTFPYDVNNESLAFFPPLVATTNACFPGVAHINDNNVAVMYQFDAEPGFNLNDVDGSPEDPIGENTIAEVSFDINEKIFAIPCNVATEEVASPEAFAMTLMPNPATNFTQLSYELNERSNITVEVTSITGQKVMIQDQGTQAAGAYQLDLNTAKLSAGVYIVSIRTADAIATSRLVVNK